MACYLAVFNHFLIVSTCCRGSNYFWEPACSHLRPRCSHSICAANSSLKFTAKKAFAFRVPFLMEILRAHTWMDHRGALTSEEAPFRTQDWASSCAAPLRPLTRSSRSIPVIPIYTCASLLQPQLHLKFIVARILLSDGTSGTIYMPWQRNPPLKHSHEPLPATTASLCQTDARLQPFFSKAWPTSTCCGYLMVRVQGVWGVGFRI